MTLTIALVETPLLLLLLACGDAGPSSKGMVPTSQPSAESLSPNHACTPNIAASCHTDADCAQCARTYRPYGRPAMVTVLTTVQCIDSACLRTGCPVDPCPQGTSCQGCVVNLPCFCGAAFP